MCVSGGSGDRYYRNPKVGLRTPPQHMDMECHESKLTLHSCMMVLFLM